MPIRQAVVLVGGLGTRLGALTRTTPKPMLEVGGRPFVELVIAHLSRFGLGEIVLLAGNHGGVFSEAYDGREMFGARISVVVEPEPLGTGGALLFAADRLAPTFAMANGDTFFDADLRPLLRLGGHPGRNAMLLRRIEKAGRYGQVVVGSDGRIMMFHEKAAAGTQPALINAGCYVLDRGAVLAQTSTLPASFETQVLPRLLEAGTLYGIEAEGYFVDIGVPSSLETARHELARARRRPAAFLDRDGVITIDHGYTHRIEDLRFVPDAAQAIRALNVAGCYTIVVTNQAGVARGLYTEEQAQAFNKAMREQLMDQAARLDAIYYCPHHPDGSVPGYSRVCGCRKPAPGLLEQVARDWPVDTDRSFLIGNMPSDLEAARAFGIPGYLHEGGSLLLTVERALTAQAARD
jgi:D,D-heptose 1,7-bisphosphate phosphatase